MSVNFVPVITPRLPLPADPCGKCVVVLKYVLSCLVTAGCVAVLAFGMGNGLAVLPGHPIVHFILFGVVLTLLAYLEGLQVAILALEHKDVDHYQNIYPRGVKLQAICARGKNVSRFLMGRQFFVIFVVFLCANITTFPDFPQGKLPNWLFILIMDTGLPGALTVLCFGQLVPQLVAQCDPMWMMNIYGSWSTLQLCLAMEYTGIPHISWLLSAGVSWMNSLPKLPSEQGNIAKGLINRRDMELVVDAADIDMKVLTQNADQGLDAVSTDDIVLNRTVQGWESAMKKWGYGPQGHHVAPLTIARELANNNDPIPRFLLPFDHNLHIPPHIVAYELMNRNGKLFNELDLLRKALKKNQSGVVSV